MRPFQALDQWLQQNEYQALLVTKPENIGYLTDFWGSFGVYLQTSSGARVLLTDGRYQETATALASARGYEFSLYQGGVPEAFTALTKANLAVEDSLTLAEFKKFENWFNRSTLTPESGVIEDLRRVKSETELNLMREAQAQVEAVLIPFLKANLKFGITEAQLKFKLDQTLRAEGRYGLSFESIVGFGAGSALPHYLSGDRPLDFGDNILIDCGVIDRHYCSDMTRNFIFGEGSKGYLADYTTLLQVQNKTLQQVKSGVKARDLDLGCREGLGDLAALFVHSLGHGVGLEIHEAPTLSKKSEDRLQTNEVVTIEPGIYKPDQYGIRIEDTTIVQPNGNKVLTQTTKDLLSFDEAGAVQTLLANA